MTIKARLALAVVALLLVLTAVLGVITIRSTRASMVGQIDDRLVSIRDRPPPPRESEAADRASDRYRDIAEFLYSSDGRLLDARPAGFSDAPEAGPALPATTAGLAALEDRVVTVPSTDGALDYRVLVFRVRDGNLKVIAQPLTQVDDAVSSLTRIFVIAGLAMVVVGAAVSWFVIRRSLRPVEGMIDTASAIASGDLSQRVDHRDDRSELGRLAHALDDMLGQLEVSFTERAAAQSRLEQFVADASHELRTPVTAIRGYAELYRGGGLQDREQLDRAMRRIEQESARMGALVEDLLVLARLDEQQPLERHPVDLGVLVEDAVADARAVDPERPITLHDPDPAIVLGDEQRLRQVLANLLTNARVHTPPRAGIHVAVERSNGRVELTVADEGPGIALHDRQRIFERFSRADRSRSRERGGAGLGLSIVAAVVAAHGGVVQVTDAPGGGAAFVVDLPAIADVPAVLSTS
ncbi:MAG TPA: HAMP domain-containing sensor histidine kinase [Acidimicrobiia bacterium]|jgi:two-component system OmpR family sensor kinase